MDVRQAHKKSKYLVFSADDFGMNFAFNNAVQEGFLKGFLTSACICANGDAFDHAINEVFPACNGLGLGIHLNIVEGKTLRTRIPRTSALYDSKGFYRFGFLSLLINSTSTRLLQEIEDDFRIQIEKILSYSYVDHINSHVHIHAIPAIFEIVCKLAEEYNIPFVRTQKEKVYAIPNISKHLNLWYPVNLVKVGLLNTCTNYNHNTLKKYNLRTNDYLIGVGYTGFMDVNTIEYGLKKVDKDDSITEILIHPCYFNSDKIDILNNKYKKARTVEFLTTMDAGLLNKINIMGMQLTNFRELTGNFSYVK